MKLHSATIHSVQLESGLLVYALKVCCSYSFTIMLNSCKQYSTISPALGTGIAITTTITFTITTKVITVATRTS